MKKYLKHIFVLIFLILSIFTIVEINKNKSSTTHGEINVVINTIEDGIVENNRVKFNENETLLDVLKNHYEIEYIDGLYGPYLTSIKAKEGAIITTSSSYIIMEIAYLNDGKTYQDSLNLNDYTFIDINESIDKIAIKNNMILALNEVDSTHSTSIKNKSEIQTKQHEILSLIFLIISIVFLILIIGYIIFSFIKNKNNSKQLTVKEITILAFMSSILLLQELFLSFLPNIQLTFLLICLYCAIFDLKKTTIIVLIHTLLDNLLFGGFNPFNFLAMFMGYFILIILFNFIKNKNQALKILIACLGCIIYSLCFALINCFVYQIDIIAYIIADIPYTILLFSSTAISIIYLYDPLYNVINKCYLKTKVI